MSHPYLSRCSPSSSPPYLISSTSPPNPPAPLPGCVNYCVHNVLDRSIVLPSHFPHSRAPCIWAVFSIHNSGHMHQEVLVFLGQEVDCYVVYWSTGLRRQFLVVAVSVTTHTSETGIDPYQWWGDHHGCHIASAVARRKRHFSLSAPRRSFMSPRAIIGHSHPHTKPRPSDAAADQF